LARFNLRVYALIINEFDEILLSDECRFGQFFSKFPGGGVEANEGIQAALHRELKEELNLEVPHAEFFYVNDFHQASAFDNSSLVAFYYLIQLPKSTLLLNENYTIPFSEETEKQRWVPLNILHKEHLTFPIDRLVLEKLLKLKFGHTAP
jgi:ADP-ribose pyrophosphatase YjhB (NUDIX family)